MKPDIFCEDVIGMWDGLLYTRTVKGKPDRRQLTKPLPCGNALIPVGFIWNGASSGLLRGIFPKWRNPIASCRHDYRCTYATCEAERAFADKMFKQDVARTSWWITALVGYIGVRIGAMLGMGVNY